jgi:hypothetical protein
MDAAHESSAADRAEALAGASARFAGASFLKVWRVALPLIGLATLGAGIWRAWHAAGADLAGRAGAFAAGLMQGLIVSGIFLPPVIFALGAAAGLALALAARLGFLVLRRGREK